MAAKPRSKKAPASEIDIGDFSSQMGIMNAFRTGNVVADTTFSMIIPIFFSTLNSWFAYAYRTFDEWLMDYLFPDEHTFVELDYEFYEDHWGDIIEKETGERNNVLQKAILAYVTEVIGYKSNETDISLSSKVGEDAIYGDTVDQLASYKINTLPPEEEYIPLVNGIEMYMETWDESAEGGRARRKKGKKKDDIYDYDKPYKKIIYYYFRVKEKDGKAKITEFIEAAKNWYMEQLKSREDDSRYLYLLSGDGKKQEAKDGIQTFKRYRLADEKKFNALFFPEKDNLLELLEHFSEKKGKYEIPGYPHKLGLLLHGPPGTGKTSLIKALAQHTKRHVVSIPLSRIKTNQELIDIVFDQTFRVKGADMPYRHSFAQVIYVMEDIDAASQIVLSREHKKPEQEVDDSPMLGPLLEDGSSGTGGDDAALLLGLLASMADTGVATGTGTGTGTSMEGFGMDSDGWITVGGGGKDFKKANGNDKLDLAGLLNVLDGVVDTPGRLLVLTTNHPEKIDPALIRPGRVDKMIYLGYILPTQAMKMIEHYFSVILTDRQREVITLALEGRVKHPSVSITEFLLSAEGEPGELFLTPAELEQLCAENDAIEDLLPALLNHSIFIESLREKEQGEPEPTQAQPSKQGGADRGEVTVTVTAEDATDMKEEGSH